MMDRYRTWKRFSCLFCCSVGQRSGNYLAFGYVLVKLLYIINAIGQLFLLNVFMGDRFHLYGFEILRKWYLGLKIEAVERFPRITMCRFVIRTLGDNIQNYDVQCLLPNNIYNEKVGHFFVRLEADQTKGDLDFSFDLVLVGIRCFGVRLWFDQMVLLFYLKITSKFYSSFFES